MKQLIFALAVINSIIIFSFPGRAQNNGSSMVPVSVVSATEKLCSCQLVELQSQGYTKQRVGIFAERNQTNGKVKGYRLMDEMIRKEKVYLQKGFVDDVKVLNKYKSPTDCMTLYHQLRQQNSNFRMYDILHVDVLLSIAGR
jgi:hypothetical protein